MTTARALRITALTSAALLALAACSSIPSSGPVNEGTGVVATAEPFVQIAVGPRADDGPTATVSGFVRASGAGFSSDFTVARDFLTSAAAATWDPTSRVIVFDSGEIKSDFNEATNTVTYDIPVLATLDDSGRLTEAEDGTRETLTYTMTKNEDGQWRIASLEDGTLLAESTFERQFSQVSLIFASVDETTQVPEMRWLPRNKDETLAARELVEGPSEWLAPAVQTGFPEVSALSVPSVVVTEGVAAVQLTADSAGSAEERALAQEQMERTLGSIPGITRVDVTAGGVTLAGEREVDLKPAPLPSTVAAAFVGGRLGAFDGADAWAVPDAVGALPAESEGLAQTFGTPTAAWIVGGSSLVTSRALEGGIGDLELAVEGSEVPATVMDTIELYKGSQLVAPSADRHSWIWTAERDGEAGFVSVKVGGSPVLISVDWLRGTSIQAISVSRDGARIAVLSRTGGKQVLEVASIVRGEDGTPLTIGQPLAVGADLGPSIDVAWVDDLTLAVLGEEGGEVSSDLWLVDVGGLTTAQKAVTHAVDITARENERSLLVVDAEGTVYARSGTVWARVVSGPSELAYSG